MKCLYYLTSTLSSTRHITDNLHRAGIDDWFIHVLSKDMPGLRKEKIHSSNYLEQLDILRPGIIGAIAGFFAGLIVAWFIDAVEPFGPDVPAIVNYAVVGVLTLFGGKRVAVPPVNDILLVASCHFLIWIGYGRYYEMASVC